jgi:hypothetical protein
MAKTPKTPSKPAGRQPQLPPGSKNVPGSEAYRKLQGAPHPGSVTIGNAFVSSHKGGAPLVVGKRHIHIEGDKKREPR